MIQTEIQTPGRATYVAQHNTNNHNSDSDSRGDALEQAIVDVRSATTQTLRQVTQEIWMQLGLKISRAALLDAVQHLERRGVLTYQRGVGGGESTITWLSNDHAHGADSASSAHANTTHTSHGSGGDGAIIEHMYYVRPGICVRVGLPLNLSHGDAERMASWLRTLPFSVA